MTVTMTSVNTATATPTVTPTYTATPETQEIKDVIAYPNPYNPAKGTYLSIAFNAAQRDCDSVQVKVYTTSLRRVRAIRLENVAARAAAARGVIDCEARYFGGLANGAYYFVVELEKDKKTARSRIENLVIIK